ncbi:MAG TPA: DHH family phosphoesterase [Candidatus Saccharibacteria bacterium]|nr:DHH family phosphoesterase [Candidatus Saccharibacteria bacterium]
MQVVTSGWKFTDIDAYGAAIAYAELLNLQGVSAKAVLEGELNDSIPRRFRELAVEYEARHDTQPDDSFIVVDVSEPENISRCVVIDQVDEVLDHHPGWEQYWGERLGEKADIEPVGAVCTQVVERWQRSGLFQQMSDTSAQLLAAGILDNTLNFRAAISTERDKKAYDELVLRANLPDGWSAQYFSECQQQIESHLEQALENDTKSMTFPGYEQLIDVAQVVVWDADKLLIRADELVTFMTGSRNWFINIVSIREGKNYILCRTPDLQAYIEQLLNINFHNNIAVTDRLWLRKEILKIAQDSISKERV